MSTTNGPMAGPPSREMLPSRSDFRAGLRRYNEAQQHISWPMLLRKQYAISFQQLPMPPFINGIFTKCSRLRRGMRWPFGQSWPYMSSPLGHMRTIQPLARKTPSRNEIKVSDLQAQTGIGRWKLCPGDRPVHQMQSADASWR